MNIRVGLEYAFEGRWLAWALDYPGCFAYGPDASGTLVQVVPALIAYQDWVARNTSHSWLANLGDFDIRLTEVWQIYRVDADYEIVLEEGYEVNAWFQQDWLPLTRVDVRRAAQLLDWTRSDLLSVVAGLTDAQLDAEYPGQRWSIRGILSHVATAEWWYLDRLGLASLARTALPKDPLERLSVVRHQLQSVLPDLEGVEQVNGKLGELWSPRKLVRRALWHERDHVNHIVQLIAINDIQSCQGA
ncbi:MAG TPA: DinB family protein [Anaerolineaceae bacterium]|jgi:hypothetical protein|nr:DinB family protein [Anaerolineaceae bacterium]